MENYSKRLEWPSPSSILPTGAESRGYGTAGSKKTSVAENGAVQFRHGSKEGAVHSSGFMPYHKALEKCPGAQNGSSSYPSVSQKSNSESPVGSNSRKHMWSRLPPSPLPPPPPPPPPSSLLVNSQELAYQERSPSCNPLGSYPLTSHEQMLLYHQSYVQAEKTNSVFALAACKGFGSPPSHEDGQMFPGSYFQQTSHSYYPGHLESYLYQAMVPPPLTPSEQLHPSKGTRAVTQRDGQGGLHPQDSCSCLYELSHCYNRVEKMEESGCKKDLCPPEKVTEKEEESSEMHKKFSVTYESRKRSIDTHSNEPGGCIIVPDSPVISHNPYSKPALPKNVLKREGSSTSSPPMPVINNVFSLAPYRAYLEGSADLVELDATKRCQAEELPPKSRGKSVDNGCVLNLPREEGTTRNTRTKSGDADLNKNSLPKGQGGGGYAGPWESFKVQLLNPTSPVSCQPSPANLSNGRTLVLPINGDARGNRHFHSSAAFLFKKFKVLKAHAAEAASGVKDVSLPKGTDSQVTQPNSPLLGLSLPQTATPSETLILQIKCLNATLPDASTLLLPSAPPGSPALREAQVLDPATEKLLGQKKPPRQYFTALHTCVCTIISGSVSTSSPDQLKEWLEMSESTVEQQEKTGKVLVKELQSQLDIFLLYNKCPFPHVMRAGATFIPIHVVKEELFPNLPGVSVDHVLSKFTGTPAHLQVGIHSLCGCVLLIAAGFNWSCGRPLGTG
uniref:Uncharacterized protein n=1 Tax=Naja naja TaxID=35670 RepID=A0A8C6Y1R5_NAJNA